MSEKEPKELKKQEGTVELTEVVTQTAPAIKLPDGKIVSMEEYFAWLGQHIYHISKNI